MAKRNKKKGVCAFCGYQGLLTTEHAPPRVIFPKPRPSNCITVLSCSKCNNECSDLDEDFGNLLAILAGQDSGEGRMLWEQRISGIRRNRRKKNDILSRLKAVPMPSPEGGEQKFQYLIMEDHSKFERIYERCFRALYFTKFGRIYPQNLKFDFVYPRLDDKELWEMLLDVCHRDLVGDRAFYYGIAQLENEPDVFMAFLVFYRRTLILGMTHDFDGILGLKPEQENKACQPSPTALVGDLFWLC